MQVQLNIVAKGMIVVDVPDNKKEAIKKIKLPLDVMDFLDSLGHKENTFPCDANDVTENLFEYNVASFEILPGVVVEEG